MSIALDVALYLREQVTPLKLTPGHLGVLYTLMFRVGSNPFSWVSQETLATELGISERQLMRYMAVLADKQKDDEGNIIYGKNALVIIEKDTKDSRKNLYKPAEFLINYHQLENRKKTKLYTKKTVDNSKNTGHICHVLADYRCHICHPLSGDRCHICHSSNEKKSLSSLQPQSLPENERSPKAKEKANNIKSKATGITNDFKISDENNHLATRRGLNPNTVHKKFVDFYKNKTVKRKDWHSQEKKWIIDERI